ncbi:hypothetical protein ACFLQ1_01955 [Candidatus Auribacterota bacterium]
MNKAIKYISILLTGNLFFSWILFQPFKKNLKDTLHPTTFFTQNQFSSSDSKEAKTSQELEKQISEAIQKHPNISLTLLKSLDEKLYNQSPAVGLPNFLTAYADWQLSLEFLNFCEKVFRYYNLEKTGLLLKKGVPCGNKKNLTMTKKLSQEWLENIKNKLPKEAYQKIKKQLNVKQGLKEIAESYLSLVSRAAVKDYAISYDKEKDAFVLKIRQDTKYLGRLLLTEYVRDLLIFKLKEWAKNRTILGKKIIIKDELEAEMGKIVSLVESGKLGRFADNHTHIGGGLSSDFIFRAAIRQVDLPEEMDLPKELYTDFKKALYPELNKPDEPKLSLDWNDSINGITDVDLTELLMLTRKIRREIVQALDLNYSIDDRDLTQQAFLSKKEKIKEKIKTYIGFKQIFLKRIVYLPIATEIPSLFDFLDVYGVSVGLLKLNISKGDSLLENSKDNMFHLIIGMYAKQIIKENKDNSYFELRLNPRRDEDGFKEVLEQATKAIKEGEKKYPHLRINIVFNFSKTEPEETLKNQTTWLTNILRDDQEMREYIKGWDSASLEIGNPPEKFEAVAQGIARYNQEKHLLKDGTPHLLQGTYHVGEDWGQVKNNR